ncbi:hypothetical protein B5S32_g4134 [[Candida] boidinii]|nr:hypothetical protein B5S29_g1109 [[Candida] boidinii]OWB79894.1 hypothetical protein B5S32_g4134 [[Candida] boidinii]
MGATQIQEPQKMLLDLNNHMKKLDLSSDTNSLSTLKNNNTTTTTTTTLSSKMDSTASSATITNNNSNNTTCSYKKEFNTGLPKLDDVLNNDIEGLFSRNNFSEYLKKTHCNENLEFYISLMNFLNKQNDNNKNNNINNTSNEYINKLWFSIYHNYIELSSIQEVNLPCALKSKMGEDNIPDNSILISSLKIIKCYLHSSFADFTNEVISNVKPSLNSNVFIDDNNTNNGDNNNKCCGGVTNTDGFIDYDEDYDEGYIGEDDNKALNTNSLVSPSSTASGSVSVSSSSNNLTNNNGKNNLNIISSSSYCTTTERAVSNRSMSPLSIENNINSAHGFNTKFSLSNNSLNKMSKKASSPTTIKNSINTTVTTTTNTNSNVIVSSDDDENEADIISPIENKRNNSTSSSNSSSKGRNQSISSSISTRSSFSHIIGNMRINNSGSHTSATSTSTSISTTVNNNNNNNNSERNSCELNDYEVDSDDKNGSSSWRKAARKLKWKR